MTDNKNQAPTTTRKLIANLVVFAIVVALAYFGGKQIGKTVAEGQNAADVAQEE